MKNTKMRLASLLRDQQGTSVMEFGLICIPITIMMMGTFDVGHTYYVKAVLSGELNKVARSSSLEGASVITQQNIIDSRLKASLREVAPLATVAVSRRYYKTFSQAAAAQAETMVGDANANAKCDPSDTYIDANNNNRWDEDGGDSGQGGAKDVVIIKVNVTFKRLFPMKALIGSDEDVVLVSDSILANQPFGNQSQYTTAVTRNCPT
jgi:Flp pilus assembly pilin Flp